jgi:hypothetical protein
MAPVVGSYVNDRLGVRSSSLATTSGPPIRGHLVPVQFREPEFAGAALRGGPLHFRPTSPASRQRRRCRLRMAAWGS